MFFIYEKRRHARNCVIWPILGTSFSANRHIHFCIQEQCLLTSDRAIHNIHIFPGKPQHQQKQLPKIMGLPLVFHVCPGSPAADQTACPLVGRIGNPPNIDDPNDQPVWSTGLPGYTLQGTNISPKNGILKMIFLFPRWDMLISWRVHILTLKSDLAEAQT